MTQASSYQIQSKCRHIKKGTLWMNFIEHCGRNTAVTISTKPLAATWKRNVSKNHITICQTLYFYRALPYFYRAWYFKVSINNRGECRMSGDKCCLLMNLRLLISQKGSSIKIPMTNGDLSQVQTIFTRPCLVFEPATLNGTSQNYRWVRISVHASGVGRG